MPLYLVERVIPGVTMDQLAASQRAAFEMSMRFTARGERVRYIRSTFIPGESRCLCLFEVASAETVEEVNEVAKFPFTRVLEAIDLTPEPWTPLPLG